MRVIKNSTTALLMMLGTFEIAQQGWVVVTLQADQYSGEASWLITDESGFVGESLQELLPATV